MASRKLEVVIVGDASSLKKALGGASREAGLFGKQLGGHTRSLARFAAGAVGVAGVGIAFKRAAQTTVDFDKSMRNVNSIAQLSERQLGKVEKQVLKLAGKTGQAPKTLADGLYDLVSSGFDAHQSMTILASSAKAATAGLTTTEVSTKGVAAVLNAYHRPASAAANVSDTLFQTVNRGVVTFDVLANNIGTVLPFAASLGVSLNQVGASLSTMTKGGISGELSITYLKNAMVSFLKPSEGMAAAVKKTGYESGEALVKAKGFQGALEAVRGTTDGSKKAMAALFPNIRSLTAALALTGKNSKTAAGDLAAFKDVTGATDTALKQQSKSVAFQWNQIKATISSLAIQLGSKLIPAVSASIQWLGKFVAQMKAGTGTAGQIRSAVVGAFNAIKPVVTSAVHAVTDLVRAFRENKTGAVLLVSALAGLAAGLAAFRILTSVVSAFKALKVAILAANLAMKANTFVLVASALIALGAALVLAYKKSQTFRNIVNGAFAAVKAGVKTAISFALGYISTLIGAYASMAHAAGKLPGPLGAPFRKLGDVLDTAKSKVDGLRDKINGLPSKKTVRVEILELVRKGKAPGLTKLPPHVGGPKGHGASVGGPSGVPSLAALDADASARVSGLLFPAVRKGELLEASAQQAVKSRRGDLVGARNSAQDALKAHPHSKALKADLAQARKALRDFDHDSKQYLSMAHGKAAGLANIQKFKDAISGLRDKLHGFAADAAASFRKGREKAIGDSPEAKELARLQGVDASEQDRKTSEGLAKDLADAKASGDVQAQKDAQDAIDAYARQKREDALQASLDSQRDGLDEEEAAYQGSLDGRLQSLVNNLDAGKESYKSFVADVQNILGPLNVGFAGDPDEEATITPVGPGKAPKKKAKPKRKKKRAIGGAVSTYRVGELGPEDVVFGADGGAHVVQASQSHGGGGVYIDMRGAKVSSKRNVRAMADRLAFRMAFG